MSFNDDANGFSTEEDGDESDASNDEFGTGHTMEYDPFYDAKTYEDMLRANVKFLRGEVENSPYYYGGVAKETKDVVEELVALHTYGFFTDDGQRGMVTDTKRQRSYLTFFVPKSPVVDAMMTYLLKSEKFYVEWSQMEDPNKSPKCNFGAVHVPVTWLKNNVGVFEPVTFLEYDQVDIEIEDTYIDKGYENIASYFRENSYYVQVGVVEIGQDVKLEKILLELCETFQVPRFKIK